MSPEVKPIAQVYSFFLEAFPYTLLLNQDHFLSLMTQKMAQALVLQLLLIKAIDW